MASSAYTDRYGVITTKKVMTQFPSGEIAYFFLLYRYWNKITGRCRNLWFFAAKSDKFYWEDMGCKALWGRFLKISV